MSNIVPGCCKSTKCMVKGCKNLSSHKVGEENIWNSYPNAKEKQYYDEFEKRHNFTSYLCEEHFSLIMDREEDYSISDNRKFLEDDYEIF
jgi:hypothetical protein